MIVVALLPMPNLLNIEPRIWLILHNTTAGKNTSDSGAVVVLKVVTTVREKNYIEFSMLLERFLAWLAAKATLMAYWFFFQMRLFLYIIFVDHFCS